MLLFIYLFGEDCTSNKALLLLIMPLNLLVTKIHDTYFN